MPRRQKRLSLLAAVHASAILLVVASCDGTSNTGTLKGTVRLSSRICPPSGGDGKGSLYLSGTSNSFGQLRELWTFGPIPVDLAQQAHTFSIDAPEGEYYLFAILYENDNLASTKGPDPGDVYGVSASKVTVRAGRASEAHVELAWTVFSGAVDYAGTCGTEPFSAAGRECAFEFAWSTVKSCYPLFGLKSTS